VNPLSNPSMDPAVVVDPLSNPSLQLLAALPNPLEMGAIRSEKERSLSQEEVMTTRSELKMSQSENRFSHRISLGAVHMDPWCEFLR